MSLTQSQPSIHVPRRPTPANPQPSPAVTPSRLGAVTMDSRAIESAVGSLHDTLRRCEDERQRLVALMNDARGVTAQADRPADVASSLAQVPALDAWISRRLAELHHTDAALARREEKLAKLEKSLSAVSDRLATQIQQLSQARQDHAGREQSVSQQIAQAIQQLDGQALEVERKMGDLNHLQSQCGDTLQAMRDEFEKLARGIVGRLEAVRKPVESWLQQQLEHYETMLNDAIGQAHEPITQRIAGLEADAIEAADAVSRSMDEKLAQMRQHVQQVADAQQQVMVEQLKAAVVQAEGEIASQSEAQQSRLRESLHVAMEKLQRDMAPMEYQFAHLVQTRADELRQMLDESLSQVMAESGRKIESAQSAMLQQMAQMDSQLRQRMASLSSDTRSMLEVIESQVARRMEAVRTQARLEAPPQAEH